MKTAFRWLSGLIPGIISPVITGVGKSSIYQHFLTLRAYRFYENGFSKFL